MSMTPEEENAAVRAEIAKEMDAEESGEGQPVDAIAAQERREATGTQEDPWEGVNPALKRAFDDMSQKVATVTATEMRLKQAESRIGSITNELHAAKDAARAASLGPTAAQLAAASESDEKWDSLKQDFPEWAEAFDGRFDKKITTEINKLRGELKSSSPSTEDLPEAIEARLLSFVKPKWKETVASSEWKEWLALQAPEEAAKIYSPKAEDAVSLITSFEESTRHVKTATEIAAERKGRLKSSILPEGGKATPIKSESDMSEAELRANIGKEVYAES